VNIDNAVPFGIRQVVEHSIAQDPDVVDQSIEPADPATPSGGNRNVALEPHVDLRFRLAAHTRSCWRRSLSVSGYRAAGAVQVSTVVASNWRRFAIETNWSAIEVTMSNQGDRPPVWIGHTTLATRDLSGTHDFMIKLGMRPIEAGDKFAVLELRDQSISPSVIEPGTIHRSFTVTSPTGHIVTFNSTHVSGRPV
jgi:hypothetical protein